MKRECRDVVYELKGVTAQLAPYERRYNPVYQKAWSAYLRRLSEGVDRGEAWDQYREDASEARALWDKAGDLRERRAKLRRHVKGLCLPQRALEAALKARKAAKISKKALR